MQGTREAKNGAKEMGRRRRDDIFDRTAEGLELRLIADGEIHNHGRRPPKRYPTSTLQPGIEMQRAKNNTTNRPPSSGNGPACPLPCSFIWTAEYVGRYLLRRARSFLWGSFTFLHQHQGPGAAHMRSGERPKIRRDIEFSI